MIEFRNVTKRYLKGTDEFIALSGFSLSVARGEYIVVNGPSGAGKSTLLYIAGGMIRPDEGEFLIEGRDLYKGTEKERNEYRRLRAGFMFQQFHLMPFLSVEENIRLGCRSENHCSDIDGYLDKCGLTSARRKLPSELSVGEKQRTAFIRAIISSPAILLADEPTGNLDPENSRILMSLISDYHREGGTVILVSHNPDASAHAVRKIGLAGGKMVL